MEKTGCKIICGAPTTPAVKELMMIMIWQSAAFGLQYNVIVSLLPYRNLPIEHREIVFLNSYSSCPVNRNIVLASLTCLRDLYCWVEITPAI